MNINYFKLLFKSFIQNFIDGFFCSNVVYWYVKKMSNSLMLYIKIFNQYNKIFVIFIICGFVY